MSKFVGIYKQDEMLGKPWTSSLLKTHISHLASKGQLRIEKEAGQQNEIAANMLRQNHHEATSYGINDDSKHQYDQDRYCDEDTVVSDGKLRYDTISDVYGVYGNQSATEREHDETYQNSKGKRESQKERVLKELKDTKVADGTAIKEAREPTKTDTRKAKATGTTAKEATIVEEEPMETAEEVPAKNENVTNNMRADPLTYQRRRCSAKSANGQRENDTLSPTT